MVTDRINRGEWIAPPAYNQDFVDMLKLEIEHYKKLYRKELQTNQLLRRQLSND